jgi:hypothetical protein
MEHRAANAANRGEGTLNLHSFYFRAFLTMIGVTGSIPVASTIVSRLAVAVLSRKPAFGDRLPSRLL